MHGIRYLSTAIALFALRLQISVVAATSLTDDPVTTCTSYDLGNKNFPGRGAEIEDDGTCTVSVPEPENPGTSTRKLEAIVRDDATKLEEFFGAKMERKLKNLPTSAIQHPSPWNGPSWLTYQDGINYEWKKGQPSPAEKYATAFGLDVKDFMDKVSAQSGIDSQKNFSTSCTSDSDCDYTMCAIRTNATSGYCIEAWYGLSHALAPASVLEKEPPVYGFDVYEQTNMALNEATQTLYHLETYPWNDNATSIVHIKSNLMWNNATDGDDSYADLVVPRDSGISYEYLLELNEAEEIIGGEWLNASINNHPDFLWFPTGKPAVDTVTGSGLSYAKVTMLLEKAAACSDSA
ncbi:Transglutaminase elicitor [Phytophthora cactorum]|nr:Transglutaminase elicitor [Phytophthora cactorum]